MVKIHCDGATSRDQKMFGVGVVIRDHNGLVLTSMSKQIPQLYSALEVEEMAASTTLSFAISWVFNGPSWSRTFLRWPQRCKITAPSFPRKVC